ncbi:hypothetical protein D9M68_693070 [compost metagenome]
MSWWRASTVGLTKPQHMLVPIIATWSPLPVTPAQKVATAASTPPAISGMPSRRPSCAAHSALRWPTTSLDSTSRGGIMRAGMPSMSSACTDQRRRAASYTPPMLPAELWSTASWPVSRQLM